MLTLSPSDWAAWVQAFGSIAAIIGAAAIAIWEARRQYKGTVKAAAEARTHFLTGKLDELYVAVLAASDDLSALYELAEPLRVGPLQSDRRERFADRLTRPRIDRLLRMYADFYFPQLNDTVASVREANRAFAKLARVVASGQEVPYDEFHAAWLRFEEALGAVRRNIVGNRASHVHSAVS